MLHSSLFRRVKKRFHHKAYQAAGSRLVSPFPNKSMHVEPLEDRRLLAAVHGQKWHDLDADGQHDPGEQGLNGWTVELRDAQGTLIATAITAASDLDADGQIDPETEAGRYSFEGLSAGTYMLNEVLQEGWFQSTADPMVNLVSDLNDEFQFSEFYCGYVGWHGLEEKWIRAEDGSGQWFYILSNGQLYRWDNVSGARLGSGSPLNGTLIATLDPIFYDNLTLLNDNPLPTSRITTMASDSVVQNADFGNYRLGSIEGRKWLDANGDGMRETDEPAFNGWTIELVDQSGSLVATATTADVDLDEDGQIEPASESGWYRFPNLAPGTYTVREVPQVGWAQSAPQQGTHTASITSGTVVQDADFGNYQQLAIQGRKWHDLDANGSQNAGEPGLNGWTIHLVDQNGDVVAMTTTADMDLNADGQIDPASESGWYRFEDVRPAVYTVREENREGWRQSAPQQLTHVIQLGMPATLSEGRAFSIADSFVDHAGTVGQPGEGSHFHASNTLPVDPIGSTVIASNFAEVGGTFGEEEVRGLIEFDLARMPLAEQTVVSFRVADLVGDLNDLPVGGLFGQEQLEGEIDVVAYQGDNAESLDDFQAISLSTLGTFSAADLAAGDTLSFDVTEVYNQQVAIGGQSLGIRLEISSAETIPLGAITFDDFQLAVAEPAQVVTAPLGLSRSLDVHAEVNFGNYQPASIRGRKWNDADSNGVWDTDEQPLNGWSIQLVASSGQIVATTTTADMDLDGDGTIVPESESGWYQFSDVAPGRYFVREVQQDGWVPTFPSTMDHEVLVASGGSLASVTFGNTEFTVVIVEVQPNPRAEPVDSVQIVFSRPVSGFDTSDLQLFRTNSGTSDLSLSTTTLTTPDGATWTLGNLSELTSVSGIYLLILDPSDSDITDAQFGSVLLAGDTAEWINGPGDSDLNGIFNQLDIVQVLQIARFLLGPPANWVQGDFTGNDQFGDEDLQIAIEVDTYLEGPFGTPASSADVGPTDAAFAQGDLAGTPGLAE